MNIKQIFDPKDCFYTSDDHFYHENIIKFCHRPYYNADTMNAELITNWNNVVPPNANVFVAGDMIHTGNIKYIKEIYDVLNGKIWLVLGNHCYQNKFDRKEIVDLFEGRIFDTLTIKVGTSFNPERFFISHYPHLYWPRGCKHLYGHVHSGPNSTSNEVVPFHPLRYDIGVDNNNYTPISHEQLIKIFDGQMQHENHEQLIETLDKQIQYGDTENI